MLSFRAKSRHICVLVLALSAAGCAHAPLSRSSAAVSRAPEIPVLLYHHVNTLPPGATRSQRRWTVSPERFEGQMRWLRDHGFHPITMAQLSRYIKEGGLLPAKPIVISFDDGWKDQYVFAFPVLKKYNFPATFFIVTDAVGHSAYMNWDQVKDMASSNMDMESHSRTHERLSILPPGKAWSEISGSKEALESRIGKDAPVFAYPFGSYGDETVNLVKKAGYDMAVTVNGLNGGYLFKADRSFTFPRMPVEGDDDLETFAQLKAVDGPLCPALFVSLVQHPTIFSSKEGIDTLIESSRKAGINTLFIQVYRENKAWFPSRVADSSPYEKHRAELGEDPFALIIKQAHLQGIQVHAWLNLLSLSKNQDAFFLKKYGTEVLTRNLSRKRSLTDYMIDSQYFLEPGDPRVQEDLSKLVGELLSAYPDLDGIQFDYIRYPDAYPHYGYTQSNMDRFKKANGVRVIDEEGQAWKKWKRDQVNGLLSRLVAAARQLRPDIQVSATGCMPYSRAYHEAYQDWPSWVAQGTVDFVTLMDYSPEPKEFSRWLKVVKEKVPDPTRLRVGVGAYKLVRNPKVFGKELQSVQKMGMSAAVFHYGSLLENEALMDTIEKINAIKQD